MKVGLVGSSGYIAEFIIDHFNKDANINLLLKIDKSNEADAYLDLSVPEKFDYDVLRDIDFVIFTAAISGPDKCARDFDFCWNINVVGTKYFISKAITSGCKVLFFSSDAVFGDIPGCIYTEKSETMATTPYGKMKKAIEDEFKMCPEFKAIRLSYVVSMKDRFVSYCLDCIENGKEAEVFHPFYRNCIVVRDVVDTVVWFLKKWDSYKPFVLNVAGNELVSRVRIADEINRIFNEKLKYRILNPMGDFFINRSKITQMKSIFIRKYDILEDASFTEKIQQEFKNRGVLL